jgi:PKD repeat protein
VEDAVNPCAGDWGGVLIELLPNYVSLSISSYSIPSEVVIEKPMPACSITVSFSFSDWNYIRDSRCIATPGQGRSIGQWKRNIGWWVCIDGVEAAYVSADELKLVYTRAGNATLPFILPVRELGQKELNIQILSVALYSRQESSDYPFCEKQTYNSWVYNAKSVVVYVNYMQGKPFCNFTASTQTGNAPLSVEFNDVSTVSKPGDPLFAITSREWDFGDGSPKEYTQKVIHLFQKPGQYKVSLTVTNSFGSDTKSMTIQVYAGPPHPVIAATTWFPQEVQVDQSFTPVVKVNNQGGPGYIFVSFVCGQKQEFLTTSMYVSGYTDNINVPISAHLPEWWLGYRPTSATYATVTLYTGPVGQPYTDAKQYQFSVLVQAPPQCVVDSDCPEGYECLNGVCVPVGEGAPKVSWPLLVGGGAVALGVILLLTKEKG